MKHTFLYFRPELYLSQGGRASTTYCMKAKMSKKNALTHLPAPNNRPFNVHYALEWGYTLHGSSVSAMTRFMVWKPFCGSNCSL